MALLILGVFRGDRLARELVSWLAVVGADRRLRAGRSRCTRRAERQVGFYGMFVTDGFARFHEGAGADRLGA